MNTWRSDDSFLQKKKFWFIDVEETRKLPLE